MPGVALIIAVMCRGGKLLHISTARNICTAIIPFQNETAHYYQNRCMSRKIISIIISIIGLTAFASGQSGRLVYVLPIQEEINPTTWLYTRQGCEEALKPTSFGKVHPMD